MKNLLKVVLFCLLLIVVGAEMQTQTHKRDCKVDPEKTPILCPSKPMKGDSGNK